MLRQSIIRQFKNFYLFNAEMFSFSLCGIKKNSNIFMESSHTYVANGMKIKFWEQKAP